MPEYGDMDFAGLDSVTPEVFSEITALNKGLWLQELELQKELLTNWLSICLRNLLLSVKS